MGDVPTIMLVHGAWHGSWCWTAVRDALHEQGFAAAAVDNPSVTEPTADLAADGDNLRRALDAVEGPVVLVGHSYGGAVITDAGTHPKVDHLVYLTAFALDAGESVAQNALLGGETNELAQAMLFDGDVVTVDPARAGELFFHDCPPDVAAAACAQLRPMSMAALVGVTRNVAWRKKPSTYVVCTDDRALPLGLQRSGAARAGTVVDMPTSHSPFLSRPDELARTLAAIATAQDL
jgi:pimeloyl-ACP methyl ester carboxylesterase